MDLISSSTYFVVISYHQNGSHLDSYMIHQILFQVLLLTHLVTNDLDIQNIHSKLENSSQTNILDYTNPREGLVLKYSLPGIEPKTQVLQSNLLPQSCGLALPI